MTNLILNVINFASFYTPFFLVNSAPSLTLSLSRSLKTLSLSLSLTLSFPLTLYLFYISLSHSLILLVSLFLTYLPFLVPFYFLSQSLSFILIAKHTLTIVLFKPLLRFSFSPFSHSLQCYFTLCHHLYSLPP